MMQKVTSRVFSKAWLQKLKARKKARRQKLIAKLKTTGFFDTLKSREKRFAIGLNRLKALKKI